MKEPSRTVAVTALVGVFVVLGTGILCDLAARLLPAHAEQATILGRDTHQTILPDLATRTRTFATVHRIILAGDDGIPFTIDAPKALHDRAMPGLMMEGMSVNIRRSVLFGKPVELEITERPLVDLGDFPALGRLLDTTGNETPARASAYDLRLPYLLSVGGLAMLGLMAWVVIRLPRKEQFVWPIFGGGMAVSAALGTWWWAA
ncbi:hypothetical protein [Chelativorans sp. Marseille-P2723]|uniref:hypothetical protein n=1 Tax=Chelativorans sp. Marseille-P2723 TaxID=2709133 RepID=UPI00156EEAD1|nr:hypothetical protein [Chelativorans sp. Marseille-P2723]